ncbi:MAG: 2Fe-2S iron-sulfur cluster binding domain-containing protein [Robiginitomaculum sp.]|nr:2Fe-2S iron-sulfur cluster binding domain-containing protein [Robiginitomaculum sp.]
MSKFYKIPVAKVEKMTPDSVVITFDIPAKLKNAFAYKAGQHVIVKTQIDGADIRRTYSFCAAPCEGEFRISVRHIEDGVFSGFANNTLKAGDVLELSKPLGAFSLDPKPGATYVGIAAGSGITPILSMIRCVLAQDDDSRFFLYYGNRDAEHTMFRRELAALKNLHMDRFSYQLFLTRQAVDNPFWGGRIDGEKITQLHKTVFKGLDVAGYYLCGPKSMVDDTRESLIASGEPASNIHSELFFAGEDGPKRTAAKAQAKAKINVIMDGREVQVDYRDEHGSILEAALSSGLDVTFACKGGVCATCRAKVKAGQVDMGINYGLEPEEIDEGFVLTCQSVPLSKAVTISFDE